MEEIKKEKKTDTRPLGKENFILMGVSVALIVIGFLLMGGGATTEETFNPDIFSTMRTAVGPGISFIGFVIMFFAILYNLSSTYKCNFLGADNKQ